MSRVIALLLIGLVVGAGVGFVIGASPRNEPLGSPIVAYSSHEHAHGTPLVLSERGNAPELSVSIKPDPVSGWNLNIVVERFEFAAERAGLDHVPGEGHAHVYVNGDKTARAYGPWLHIAELPEGSVEIEVTLNSNDHRALVIDDKPISATITFQNP